MEAAAFVTVSVVVGAAMTRPASVAWTVWAPTIVGVHVCNGQRAPASMVKVVVGVAFQVLPSAFSPVAVYDLPAPATTDALSWSMVRIERADWYAPESH